MQRLEVAADRHGLGDQRAVVEAKRRHDHRRVVAHELRVELFALSQVDLHARHLEAFFSQKHANAARVGGEFKVVKQHGKTPGRRSAASGVGGTCCGYHTGR